MKKRNKMLTVFFLLSTISLIILASQADSADFTFHVPVELNNLPEDVTTGHISCNVCPSTNPPTISAVGVGCGYGLATQATAGAYFNIGGGNYSATQTVTANFRPDVDRYSASKWYCYLRLGTRDGKERRPVEVLGTALDPSKPIKDAIIGNISPIMKNQATIPTTRE